jgi:hypothetical protein
MKKISIVCILFLTIITLSSCALIGMKPGSNNSIFDNISTQTAQEIKDKIDFYKTRLLTLIDQPSEQSTYSNRKLSIETVDGSVIYPRDELPIEYDYPYDPDAVDPEFIMTKTMLLNEYEEAIDACDGFKEDAFCTVELEHDNVYLKVLNEGDKLFIEAYRYHVDYQSVNVDLIYLDLVEDKVQLQYVRDHYRRSENFDTHDRYFDIFNESGDMLNIHVNMKNDEEVYYQNAVRSSQNVFLFHNSEEGLGFNYTDSEQEIFYSVTFDAIGEIQNNFLSYGIHNPTFRYSQATYNESVRLTWNLLDVDGWNKALVNENDYDKIYLDDTELLTGFLTDFSVQEHITAMTSITISEEEFSQQLINLSDYGLSYDEISYQQLITDRSYLANHYIDILEARGFVEDMSENKVRLLAMFPFVGDEDIINDLFAQMEI